MSVVDQIRSLFSSSDSAPAGTSGPMVEHLASMIGSSGGLPALLQKFRDAGLGGAVDSWIGKGANVPLSGQHVESALGSDTIRAMAQKLGMNPDQASSGLAALLPQMVDKLTPNGTMPEHGMLEQALNALKSKLPN